MAAVMEYDIVQKDGLLQCRAHEDNTYLNWCDHIKKFIVEDADAMFIWRPNSVPISACQEEIDVPYIPTYGQRAKCRITELNENWMLQIGISQSEDWNVPDLLWTNLGFVNSGEGRRVFRLMVDDWFQPKIDYSSECTATVHGYAADKKWRDHMKSHDTALKLAERWSVFMKGKCLECAGANPITDDDLVPF